jgi:hypothetical protein
MTSHYPFEGEIAALEWTVLRNRLVRICRTTGKESAGWGKERGDQDLIQFDECEKGKGKQLS